MRMKRSMMIALAIVLCLVFTRDVFTQKNKKTNNKNLTERKIGKIRIRGGIKGGRAFTRIPHLNGELFAPTTPIKPPTMSTASEAMRSPGSASVSPDFGGKWGWVVGPFLKFEKVESEKNEFGETILEKTSRLAIELDVLYSQKGAKSSISIGGINYEIIVNIDYIEVPVLLNFRVQGGLSLCLGPYVAVRVIADDDVLEAAGSIPGLEELPWELKEVDWGITFGGSFQTGKFIIEPRCSLGMERIFSDVTDETDAKNFAVNLMVGFEL